MGLNDKGSHGVQPAAEKHSAQNSELALPVTVGGTGKEWRARGQ